MAAMLLADLGATVIRVDRTQASELGVARPSAYNLVLRNRPVIAVDLKRTEGVELVLRLIDSADGLIEGFRPGVMERLGLGPDICHARNQKLVYGRMTGWGQTGPLAKVAGHDLNYIALTGGLDSIGRENQPPTPPLNLVGDYGGGALYLALGILAAIIEARKSGQGQVVDAAIIDGAASLLTSLYGMYGAGMLGARGTNLTDSGAYFYDCYPCADGQWISVAPLERKFFEQLITRMEINSQEIGDQLDRSYWSKARKLFAERFLQRNRSEWLRLFDGTDCCVAPVLSLRDAPTHPHMKERKTFIELDGIVQPAPAPRFSRTVPAVPTPPANLTPDATDNALAVWLRPEEMQQVKNLRKNGIII